MKLAHLSIALLLLLPGASALAEAPPPGAPRISTIRIVPVYARGELFGIRLFNIASQPALTKLGLEDGDLLYVVDDEPIRSAGQLLTAADKLREARVARVKIDRRGQSLTLPREEPTSSENEASDPGTTR